MPCSLLNNIYGGNCIAHRLETTLNISVTRVTFLLFSSVGLFQIIQNYHDSSGSGAIFIHYTRRAARLCTLSMSFICF